MNQSHPRRARPRRAFTLMEVMIAVAALAVVAAGIAAVFELTGRTVTGGRRISALNSYANLIENQMRADFEAISREGFLAIRNQWVDADGNGLINAADTVQLHADDTSPRPRRVDEIIFFAKRPFTSAREPLHPQLIATGDSARIYYGHGQRGRPGASSTTNPDWYWRPELNDSNIDSMARLGYRTPPGVTNPNRYASEWTLLRHTTVLIPRNDQVAARTPRPSRPMLSPTPLFPNANNDQRLWDSEIQVALQPAAPSIFRALNSDVFPNIARMNSGTQTIIDPVTGLPMSVPNPVFTALRRNPGNVWPQFSSGLVDIATTSLDEIRSIVMTADSWPGGPPTGFPGIAADNRFFDPAFNSGPDGNNAGLDGRYRRHGTNPGQDPRLIQRTHAWMDDAFPTRSAFGANPQQARRVRYETRPPNLVGSLGGGGLSGGPWTTEVQTAFRRADQAMLASWGFLPNCTEFIVEWTFGRTFPSDPTAANYIEARAGQLIWHGLERTADNQPPTLANLPLAWPLGIGSPPGPANIVGYWAGTGAATSQLIHGLDPNQHSPAGPLTSYFGYINPAHNPTTEEPTAPWPWPTMIRVTLSLADPRSPSTEATFQFVFEVPRP